MSLKRPFVPKSDVKQCITTATTTTPPPPYGGLPPPAIFIPFDLLGPEGHVTRLNLRDGYMLWGSVIVYSNYMIDGFKSVDLTLIST